MDSAIRYASEKFKQPKETVDQNGIVTITESQISLIEPARNQIRYVIDPSKITMGLINDDNDEDAVINILSIDGNNMENPENLFLIQSDGKFMLNRVIESNMKILGIKDHIITAEVSTRSLNTPLRDCHVCKEVVKYQFKSGDLIRID